MSGQQSAFNFNMPGMMQPLPDPQPGMFRMNWEDPNAYGYQFDSSGINQTAIQNIGNNPQSFDMTRQATQTTKTADPNTWNAGQWLQLGTGMVGAYTGYRQVQNAEDMLAENKRQFNMNWEAQRGLTNAQLEARRQRQIAAQGVASGNGMTAQEYVAKYGVK